MSRKSKSFKTSASFKTSLVSYAAIMMGLGNVAVAAEAAHHVAPAIAAAAIGKAGSKDAAPAKVEIPGYSYGSEDIAAAPFTVEDLETLKATVLFTDEDAEWLRKSRAVLEPHAEEILDTWYGFVGANPHLIYYFNNSEGAPDTEYLGRVRARFIQWIYDTADANYDQDWLNYQYEIGRRHHRIGKNAADGATGPDHIPVRYVIGLHYPVTATLRPFLERGEHSAEEVDKMHQAWIKSVLMQVILWSHPYITEGDF